MVFEISRWSTYLWFVWCSSSLEFSLERYVFCWYWTMSSTSKSCCHRWNWIRFRTEVRHLDRKFVISCSSFRNKCKTHVQTRAFEAQLKLAAKWQKPIVIHSRDAYPETFKLMKEVCSSSSSLHQTWKCSLNSVLVFISES